MESSQLKRSHQSGGEEGSNFFYLKVDFKRSATSNREGVLAIQPNQLDGLTIVLDLFQLLPSFRMRIQDSAGVITHLIPLDKDLSRVFITFGGVVLPGLENTSEYYFDVYRAFPSSNNIYEVIGALVAKELLSVDRVRSFSGTVKSTIESISEESEMNGSEVSGSLEFKKAIVQPGWTNAKLLNYLKTTLQGSSREGSFYSFVKIQGTDKYLVFKSYKDFAMSGVKFRFQLGGNPSYEIDSDEYYFPIFEFKAYDNYKIVAAFGSRSRNYSYYDYANGKFVVDTVKLVGNSDSREDFYSLTERFLIDGSDSQTDCMTLNNCGRDSDFRGRVLGQYHDDLLGLSKLWITTFGIHTISPGDIVDILFLEHLIPGKEFGCNYHGYWMVERVIHMMGHTYLTRLLLTRCGVTSSQDSTLIKATKRKK